MKLDPVYVLAPRPQIATRRAFVLAGATGCLAFAAGFAGGYWFRHSRDEQPPRPPGNPRIDWARSLALGDDTTLLDNLPAFLGVCHEAHQLGLDDVSLWDSIRRAAKAVIADAGLEQRRIKARALLTVIDLRPDDADLLELRRQLEALTRR